MPLVGGKKAKSVGAAAAASSLASSAMVDSGGRSLSSRTFLARRAPALRREEMSWASVMGWEARAEETAMCPRATR